MFTAEHPEGTSSSFTLYRLAEEDSEITSYILLSYFTGLSKNKPYVFQCKDPL